MDSILPVDEEIRRFRTAIGGQPVSALNTASDSREALVRRIMKARKPALRYVDHKCDPGPDRNGRNLIWTNCFVRVTGPSGDTTSHRLFGSVIQRDGRFKIVSFKNEF